MKKYGLLITTLIAALVFMPLMMILFMNNDVLAGDFVLSDEVSPEAKTEETTVSSNGDVEIVGVLPEDMKVSLSIPVEDGVRPSDIEIREDRDNGFIKVTLPSTDPEFYYRNQLSGSQNGIADISYDHDGNSAEFVISTDGYMITKAYATPGALIFSIDAPRDLYGHVIVIDPKYGGDENGSMAYGVSEKDIALGLAKGIRDAGVGCGDEGIYLTRQDDESVSDEARKAVAVRMEPDVYIRISTSADKETRRTNGISAIAGSVDAASKARQILAALCDAYGQQNLGVALNKSSADPDVTGDFIEIKLGYITNKTEALMIAGDEYGTGAGKIIYDTLTEIYGKTEE